MSKLSTQPYRGTRDFTPREMYLQNYIYATWRSACTSFGYEEYMTPTIEPLEIYTSKTSEEIVSKQTYSFTDRGDRTVTIRPEMTPSVSRLVAGSRNEFSYPLRLFSIPNCMRYERPQKGRLREFWQLNADIFGVEGIEADIEIIQLANHIMRAFGAKESMYEIKVNSRKLLDMAVANAKPNNNPQDVVRLIDQKDKMSSAEFEAALDELVEGTRGLIDYLNPKTGNHHNVDDLMNSLKARGIKATFDPSLARGFDYYNDIVFEVFDTNPDNNRSMFGGGRYDSLVGLFGGGDVASVGFGMGDATLAEFLVGHKLAPVYQPHTDVWLGVIGENNLAADGVANELRALQVNVAIDYSGRKPEKQLKSAIKAQVPFMLFVGDEEATSSKLTLKELASKKEHTGSVDELAKIVNDYNSQQ